MENPPTYLVCATHRSGSNLLCQALWHTDLCGRPQEFFSPTRASKIVGEHGLDADPVKDYEGYLRTLRSHRATENGVFGGKIMWAHLDAVREGLHAPANTSMAVVLKSVLPNLRFIHARRNDTLRQAISMWKAKQTKIYNSLQEGQRQSEGGTAFRLRGNPQDSWSDLRKKMPHGKRSLNKNDIGPFEVRYEDFVDDYEATTRRIVQFLGIPAPENFPVKPTTYKKLSDQVNEEWRRRYLEHEAELG